MFEVFFFFYPFNRIKLCLFVWTHPIRMSALDDKMCFNKADPWLYMCVRYPAPRPPHHVSCTWLFKLLVGGPAISEQLLGCWWAPRENSPIPEPLFCWLQINGFVSEISDDPPTSNIRHLSVTLISVRRSIVRECIDLNSFCGLCNGCCSTSAFCDRQMSSIDKVSWPLDSRVPRFFPPMKSRNLWRSHCPQLF